MRLLVILTAPSYRALVRMGNVYYKQKQWKEAIKCFDKSLTEHRNAEVLKKKQTVSEYREYNLCIREVIWFIFVPVNYLYIRMWRI